MNNYDESIINTTLSYVRDKVTQKIQELIKSKRQIKGSYKQLYKYLEDYPFRKGKALRPALCISTARSIGGMAQSALVSSAALEMYHNAFLIHDDIEDGSINRRGKKTLHQLMGIPRSLNTGDATFVMALSFLLENLNTVGLSKSIHIMNEVENMARQSVEGQSMELDWVADNIFNLGDKDYFNMCVKKTCWYTFITPCRIGYIVGTPSWSERKMISDLSMLTKFGMFLGVAFQIQDDLLNLTSTIEKYGKEIGGDIYEGKRTIMLNHVISNSRINSEKIKRIIRIPRSQKTEKDAYFILNEMLKCGSIEYGKQLAGKFALKAKKLLNEINFLSDNRYIAHEENWNCAVADKRFITELVNYVVLRKL